MKKIFLIFGGDGWAPGDPIIYRGLLNIMPELKQNEIIFSGNHPMTDEIKKKLIESDYVIRVGTPSWMGPIDTTTWNMCIEHNKRLSLLAIGTGISQRDPYISVEEIKKLINSGLLDVVICRDQLCYYHLRAMGCPRKIMTILPCSGYFLFEDTELITDKKEVALDIVDIVECSHHREQTFNEYYEKMHYLLDGLRNMGANVTLGYQRLDSIFPEKFKNLFPGEKLHTFPSCESFKAYYRTKHIYIGARVHGTLPCAGRGMPCFELGVDNRHFAWEQNPFIAKLDIRYLNGEWNPDVVLDWYDSLDPEGVSRSLIRWREKMHNRWRKKIECLISSLHIKEEAIE